MLNSFDTNEIEINRIQNLMNKIGQGRQSKWLIKNKYYKVDSQIGCEGLAETIVSDMLKNSNMARYFTYDPVRINVGNQSYKGCVSPNGLADGEQLITAYDILKRSKSPFFRRIEDAFDYGTPKEYLMEFISEMERLTNIENFGEYIKAILELDAITLNNDRHMNNICVVRNGKEFSVGPVFDNGHSFLLWRRKNIRAMEPLKAVTVEAMPFSHSFETQRRIAQELYGGMFLKINYGAKDLKETLRRCETCYNEKDLEFAEKVCRAQMNLNIDYFFNDERAEWVENLTKILSEKFQRVFDIEERGHDYIVRTENSDFELIVRPSGFVATNNNSDGLFEIAQKYGEEVLEIYRTVAEVGQEQSNKYKIQDLEKHR